MNSSNPLLPAPRTLMSLQKWLYVLLLLVFVVVIIPFFLLIFYTHPSADDYCYANAFRHGSLWSSTVGEYLNWKGRYLGIFLTVMFHQSGDMLEHYHYPLFIFIGLLFVAFYFLTRELFENRTSFVQTFYCAFLLAVFFLVTLQKTSSFLYWVDAAYQYNLGSTFFLLSIAAISRMYRQSSPSPVVILAASLFIFAAIGSTEIFMIALFSLVSVIFLYKFFMVKEARMAWSFVYAVTILSTLLLLLSPGNGERMALNSEYNNQFWFSVKHAIYYGSETVGYWLSDPAFWLITILFVPMALYLSYIGKIRQDASWNRFTIFVLLLAAQLFTSFFGTWWAAVTHPVGRTMNVIYLVFLVSWFNLVLELVVLVSRQNRLVYIERLFSVPARLFIMIVTLSLAALITTRPHAVMAYEAMTGSAKYYNEYMHERYESIREAKKNHPNEKIHLSVKKPEQIPQILFFADITHNRNDWKNLCMARYYGLGSIVTEY